MTLLYAAEYNGEPNQEICLELRELFGCMTSEHLDTRPDLESIITQCEEELCGKSSQEICCGIGGFAAPFTPAPGGCLLINLFKNTVNREIFAPILFPPFLPTSSYKFKTSKIRYLKLSLFYYNCVWANSRVGQTVCKCKGEKITITL